MAIIRNDESGAACLGAKNPSAGWLWRRRRSQWRGPEDVGPPNGFAMLPWLLMGMGSVSSLVQGETPNPVIGALGLLTFNSLYVNVVFRAFHKDKREARATRRMLIVMGLVTFGLATCYGGSWLLFYPLFALAVGSVLRGRLLGPVIIALTTLAGVTAGFHNGWNAVGIAYGTFISGMVTAAILALSETVKELRATREELARGAVERERLRFSRDLHDLLGHTLSVIVVKSEAARRIASRDLEAALDQVTDIESVGRQALTEIREAVTGYREGSLTTELDRARSALTAAGIEPVVHRSGPPLTAQHEALLGWVVREAVTNAVRHSAADHCEITVSGSTERVRLRVTDNGRGPADGTGSGTADDDGGAIGAIGAPRAAGTAESGGAGGADGAIGGSDGSGTAGRAAFGAPGGARRVGGTGLKGLTERLAAAGGSLVAGAGQRGGFEVAAELPVERTTPPAARPATGSAKRPARPPEPASAGR